MDNDDQAMPDITLRVMVIDDSLVNRSLATASLNGMDTFDWRGRTVRLEAIAEENPVEALKMLESQIPLVDIDAGGAGTGADVVVVDYDMPQMSGLNLLQQLRKLPRYSNVPTIMLTGANDKDVLYRAFEMGIDDFIYKSYRVVDPQTGKAMGAPVPLDQLEFRFRVKAQAIRRLEWLALEALATRDGLTRLLNRRAWVDQSNQKLAQANRYGEDLSVVMIDIDHFKKINDQFGHHAGDEVLRRIGQICQKTVREIDVVGRLGGEELAVLMPRSDLNAAIVGAERLRKSIEGYAFSHGLVTASFGVASYKPGENLDNMMRRADAALYDAKNSGRNRVEASRVMMFGKG